MPNQNCIEKQVETSESIYNGTLSLHKSSYNPDAAISHFLKEKETNSYISFVRNIKKLLMK